MRTKHTCMFVIRRCFIILKPRFRASKTGLSPAPSNYSTDHFKMVPLLQFHLFFRLSVRFHMCRILFVNVNIFFVRSS